MSRRILIAKHKSPVLWIDNLDRDRPLRWIKKIKQDGTIELVSVEIKKEK